MHELDGITYGGKQTYYEIDLDVTKGSWGDAAIERALSTERVRASIVSVTGKDITFHDDWSNQTGCWDRANVTEVRHKDPETGQWRTVPLSLGEVSTPAVSRTEKQDQGATTVYSGKTIFFKVTVLPGNSPGSKTLDHQFKACLVTMDEAWVKFYNHEQDGPVQSWVRTVVKDVQCLNQLTERWESLEWESLNKELYPESTEQTEESDMNDRVKYSGDEANYQIDQSYTEGSLNSPAPTKKRTLYARAAEVVFTEREVVFRDVQGNQTGRYLRADVVQIRHEDPETKHWTVLEEDYGQDEESEPETPPQGEIKNYGPRETYMLRFLGEHNRVVKDNVSRVAVSDKHVELYDAWDNCMSWKKSEVSHVTRLDKSGEWMPFWFNPNQVDSAKTEPAPELTKVQEYGEKLLAKGAEMAETLGTQLPEEAKMLITQGTEIRIPLGKIVVQDLIGALSYIDPQWDVEIDAETNYPGYLVITAAPRELAVDKNIKYRRWVG
jgi:hypothetical protein